MKTAKYFTRIMLLFSALILVGLGGCVPVEKVPGSGGELIQIQQGNVGTFHELRLGVANIIKVDYLDEASAKKQGLMAALTLFIDGNPRRKRILKFMRGRR